MNVIVCVDDQRGMLFNKRRLSRDEAVVKDIFSMTDKIWVHTFSEKMMSEYGATCIVNDAFLDMATEGEYCFVENQSIVPYEEKIERLIVYQWNRKYPSDFKLDIKLDKWRSLSREEFGGKSHEKITREIYERGLS